MDSIVEMAHTQLGPLLEEIRSWRESTRALNQNLIVVACINIRHKDLIGHQQLHEFLLFGNGVRLLGIAHAVIHHAPDRRIPGTGNSGHISMVCCPLNT